jgi:3-hydroxybutyryl-CoA dehydrogenase
MKLAVITNEVLKEEFLTKGIPEGIETVFIQQVESVPSDADIIFDLLFENTAERINLLRQFLPAIVFINSVTAALTTIQAPFIRINAWTTFLKRNISEIAVLAEQPIEKIKNIFMQLGWNCQVVPDITGMISARVVVSIINEAYFTFGQGVSSKEEIDIAMKLGTNYPHGPFEWAAIIGIENVFELLNALYEEDKRYEIAPALTAELAAYKDLMQKAK